MIGGIKQRLKIRSSVPERSLPSANGGILGWTGRKRFSVHNLLDDHGFIVLVRLNKARQLCMQTMTVAAKRSWHEQPDLTAAAQAEQAKMMVIAGKRLTSSRADGNFFTFDQE